MKCPLKFKEFSESAHQECDEECAWLVGVTNKDGMYFKACAVAVHTPGTKKILNNMGWVKEGE